jgi:nicotinate phosphoribosyltransferase
MPIIESLLDTDLYKLSMMQFVYHQCSDVKVKYKFKCRNEGIEFPWDDIYSEIEALSRITFKSDELNYLRSLGYFKDDFLSYLKNFKLRIETVHINDGLWIEGNWLDTILWEVPVLAIINECYFRTQRRVHLKDSIAILDNKMESIEGIDLTFADFGTRRRRSRAWHETLIERIKDEPQLIGTSNVMLAKKYGLKPIGTMAHEIFQVFQALVHPLDSQKVALQKWADEYRGQLGIALSDTLGVDKFIKDFDRYFAMLFDGVRHDSGNPFRWGDKILNHYRELGIDPKTKTAIFSDGLTFDLMEEINYVYSGRIKLSFGVGTNLTNDVGVEPVQIVIKVVEANERPVAKLSDSEGKEMCEDQEYIGYLKKAIAEIG